MATILDRIENLAETHSIIGLTGPTGTFKSRLLYSAYEQMCDNGGRACYHFNSFDKVCIDFLKHKKYAVVFVDNYCESAIYAEEHAGFETGLEANKCTLVFATAYSCTAHAIPNAVRIDVGFPSYGKYTAYYEETDPNRYLLYNGCTSWSNAEYYLKVVLPLDIEQAGGSSLVTESVLDFLSYSVAQLRMHEPIGEPTIDSDWESVKKVIDILIKGRVIMKVTVNDSVNYIPRYSYLLHYDTCMDDIKDIETVKTIYLGVALNENYEIPCSYICEDDTLRLHVHDCAGHFYVCDKEPAGYSPNVYNISELNIPTLFRHFVDRNPNTTWNDLKG